MYVTIFCFIFNIIYFFLQVPNYYKIITNPIDFLKIKVKVQRQNFNHYDSVEEFIADVKLVFQNCATYNAVSS